MQPTRQDQIETVAQLLHEKRHRAGTGQACTPCRDDAAAIAAVLAPLAPFATAGTTRHLADGTD